jgi:5-dehydro-2-deoxygluconokinase
MTLQFDQTKPRDVVAMGRATVDLYANEMGPLEDAVTFSKYVGGSPANTAVAMSNMGLAVGYIGKVSDDQFGRFITRYLARKGVDISHVAYDKSGARSGVTIGEIKSPTDCSFFVYRQHVACDEIDEHYISQHKALLISGTSLSHSTAREAVFLAMEYAKRNNVRIIFDPDYREGTWKSKEETAIYYLLAAEKADMVVGTREEYDQLESLIMPGNKDDVKTAKNLFSRNAKLVSIKHGKQGSTIYTREGEVHVGKVYPAKVVKTFGAGDAYAGSFIYGLIRGKTIDEALKYAAAAASITIGGHSCSDSTPTLKDVESYMAAYETNAGKS